VRHIYGHLRTMFHEAVTDELVSATPCVLKKGELPKKIDKDPTWRARAVFTRQEVECLLSDERISRLHRVRYAALFLTGVRIGELSERRWRDWDATTEPLGLLSVATSYNRKEKRVKSVKTERPRLVPVHTTLAKVLASWRLSGWEAVFGRAPGPDDLICPSSAGAHLRDTVVLREFHADCQTIGIRPRRTHDTRRTFISLARANGANKDILRQVTHQPEGDQVDDYTTLPWETLCTEVAKLKIKLLEGKLLPLSAVANAGVGGNTMPLQSPLHSKSDSQEAEQIQHNEAVAEFGRGGTRTLTLSQQQTPTDNKEHQVIGVYDPGSSNEEQAATAHRSNVADRLMRARNAWLATGDAEALCAALLAIVGKVGGAK
jgi:site-specific recombinase XerD